MSQYFTITAGRTGTAWLSAFLSANLNVEAVHEPLDVNDFGEIMPDIRTMRNFNNFGNNRFVREFWKRKFSHISDEVYVETNHTLSKCGLIENIILNKRADKTKIIVLKRDMVKQCVSYIVRNDFQNITLAWQWYLHPTYIKKIIDPRAFSQFGDVGLPLWYCYEMAARQEYYVQKFSDQIRMYEIKLEDCVTEAGANSFHAQLGNSGECVLPPPQNQNKAKPNIHVLNFVQNIINKINVDIKDLVKGSIEAGFTFSEKSG